MLLVYDYVLLKMSTWYAKHVEESNNIWWINNIQCITLVVLYGQKNILFSNVIYTLYCKVIIKQKIVDRKLERKYHQSFICNDRFQWSSKYQNFSKRQWHTQEFCLGGGSTNSVEGKGQRERGSGGSRPLVRGSGGSCNLVQEISFHIVKFS